jgi:hypothetical protein
MLGASSADVRLEGRYRVVGPTRELRLRDVVPTTVAID